MDFLILVLIRFFKVNECYQTNLILNQLDYSISGKICIKLSGNLNRVRKFQKFNKQISLMNIQSRKKPLKKCLKVFDFLVRW